MWLSNSSVGRKVVMSSWELTGTRWLQLPGWLPSS